MNGEHFNPNSNESSTEVPQFADPEAQENYEQKKQLVEQYNEYLSALQSKQEEVFAAGAQYRQTHGVDNEQSKVDLEKLNREIRHVEDVLADLQEEVGAVDSQEANDVSDFLSAWRTKLGENPHR